MRAQTSVPFLDAKDAKHCYSGEDTSIVRVISLCLTWVFTWVLYLLPLLYTCFHKLGANEQKYVDLGLQLEVPYEFIVSYKITLSNLVPKGEQLNISTPMFPLLPDSSYKFTRSCPIEVGKYSLFIKASAKLSKKEAEALIRKETRRKMKDLLNSYKDELLDCLLQNKAMIEERQETVDYRARVHTILEVSPVRILATFINSTLLLNLYEKVELDEDSHS